VVLGDGGAGKRVVHWAGKKIACKVTGVIGGVGGMMGNNKWPRGDSILQTSFASVRLWISLIFMSRKFKLFLEKCYKFANKLTICNIKQFLPEEWS